MEKAANATNGTIVPRHLLSDYIEMAYLFGIIVVATPPNVIILQRLLAERRRTPRDSVKAGFLLLKINLNISDLLILTILAFGKLLWLITYSWKGGNFLCKAFNFLSMIALYISSNIVVCIALDRLRNVLRASQLRTNNAATVRAMIFTAWMFAVLFSLPQLHVWALIDLNEGSSKADHFVQCSDIWAINDWKISQMLYRNETVSASFVLNQDHGTYYNVFHLLVVFWGPVAILLVCYFTIAVQLTQYSLKAPAQSHSWCENSQVTTMLTRQNENGIIFENACGQRASISLSGIRELCENPSGPTAVTTDHTITTLLEPQIPRRCNSQKYARSSIPRSMTKLSTASAPRLSFSKKLSNPFGLLKRNESSGLSERSSVSALGPRLPSWRRQLRSKVFRTTLLVVLTHVILWFPYNFQAIIKYANADVYDQLSDHANIFKDLQFLITLINPFLYGFLYN